jgi:hypothetical protein
VQVALRPRQRSGFALGIATAACVIALFAAQSALCGPIGLDSSVGVAGGYNSNPFLLPSEVQSAESEALLLNLPVSYQGAEQTFELAPRFRQAISQGVEALLSNYQDLDSDWKFKGERNDISAAASWHRDSTLYNQFEDAVLGGKSFRRLEDTGSLSWENQLTEVSDVQLISSIDHVGYSTTAASLLTSYQYEQLALEYDRSLTERWQWTSTAGYGRYQVLNYAYTSDNRFVQSSLSRALSEQWSLVAQAGYSYLSASEQVDTPYLYLCEENGQLVLCEGLTQSLQHFGAGTPNYSVSLEHRGERLTLDAGVSRSIQPNGLGALLTQDDTSIRATYAWTETLNLTGSLEDSSLTDSLQRLKFGDRHFYNAGLSANWQFSEYWTLGLQAGYLVQRLDGENSAGTTVSLNIMRALGRISWH